jgi:hypothetical protein
VVAPLAIACGSAGRQGMQEMAADQIRAVARLRQLAAYIWGILPRAAHSQTRACHWAIIGCPYQGFNWLLRRHRACNSAKTWPLAMGCELETPDRKFRLPFPTLFPPIKPRNSSIKPAFFARNDRPVFDETLRAEVFLILCFVAPRSRIHADTLPRRSAHKTKIPLSGGVQSFSTGCYTQNFGNGLRALLTVRYFVTMQWNKIAGKNFRRSDPQNSRVRSRKYRC